MFKKLSLGLLLLTLFLSTASLASDTVISDIQIKGNKQVSSNTILKAMSLKIADFWDQGAINKDIKQIYALGYFENVEATTEDYKKGSRIIITVLENPPIKGIVFSGNTVYSTEELLSLINVKEDQILNFKLLRNDIDVIKEKYQEDGYILVKIVDVKTDPKTEVLTFNLSEGWVQGITIEGNSNTKDYVILRELNTKSGNVFNEQTLKKDIRRIFNLGYFSEINPQFQPGSTDNSLIIMLGIKEAKTSTVNFGGGFGEREGWFGFVDLSLNNLQGTAQNLLLKGQSGQELSTYQLKYYNPWFLPEKLGPRTSLTYKLWNTMGRDIYLTLQDELHIGWDVAVGKEINDNYRTSTSFGSENVSPRNAATFEAYISTFIGQSFSYDTRDVWTNPSSGALHTVSLKQGWKSAGSTGTTNYTKYGLDLNRYVPLMDKTVFAWHIGTGLGAGDIPIGELYWAGGPNTVRGYALADIKKGQKKLITNWELRYSFNETFQGVVFFDWGNAWYTGFPEFGDFIAGWGPGVRVTTPLGPIRLDYGMATNRGFGEGILHFSIGQAF